MLFMVTEHFKEGKAQVGERYKTHGRMLPDGVTYHGSWVDLTGTRCFQLMEAVDATALAPWLSRWSDLIDFEVTAVAPSSDFWH